MNLTRGLLTNSPICETEETYDYDYDFTQGRPSDFQSGGGHQQKRALSGKKRAPTVGNLKAKINNFLDIGIYPYIVITLSGMISIFVSLHTSYKISLKHHTLQLGVMSEYALTSERSEREKF